MKTLITGATGFIGRQLVSRLLRRNHDLVILTRDPESAREKLGVPCDIRAWDPLSGPPSLDAFQGVDAVIHLAGENIGEKRWSAAQKKLIRDSRILGTRHLVDAINRRKGKPLNVICSSAIGYYGDRGEEELHELSPPGTGFLAETCRDWEKEAKALPYGHGRLVILRTGVVLGADSGLLKKLIPIFKTGTAGPLGSGKQWMSWIHVDDLVSLFVLALENPAIEGAMNAVSPNPVTNADFTRALAKAVHRPAVLKAPAVAIKTMLGEMSELALTSQRVVPDKALATGFQFKFPTVDSALDDLVGRRNGAVEFVCEQWFPQPIEKVFSFFADETNLARITPPWLGFHFLTKNTASITEGTLLDYKIKVKGIPLHWQSRIEQWEPNKRFIDRQMRGPYSQWEHTHSFEKVKGGTLVRDRVLYSIPGGFLGKGLMGRTVRKDLDKIFRYRREQLPKLLAADAAPAPAAPPAGKPA